MSTITLLAPAPRLAVQTPLQPAPAERLVFIDALRGIAALAVACYHIHRYGPLHEAAATLIPAPLATVFEHGWGGVQVFFVISGFVIAYSVRDAIISPRFLANFALRRSIRLDPPYWITIGVVLLLLAVLRPLHVVDPLTDPPSARQLLAHGLYLQDVLGYGNVSVGLWSLCIEVQFYLALIVLLGVAQWLKRRLGPGRWVGPASLLAIAGPLAVASLINYERGGDYEAWLIHFFYMFFVGVLACWTLAGRIPAAVFWGYVALLVGRLAVGWSLEVALATVAGVAIYLVGRRGKLSSWLSARPLVYLGRISYSLYLIHYPVSWLVVGVGYRLTGEQPMFAVMWLLLALGLSIAAAQLLYRLVEAPSVSLARRLKPAEAPIIVGPIATVASG